MLNPTNIAKVTFVFSDGRYSWQEVYYRQSATAGKLQVGQIDLSAVLALAIPLAKLRSAMLPSGGNLCSGGTFTGVTGVPKLVYIRVSQVGYPRNTLFFDPAAGPIVSSGLPGLVQAPFSADALLLSQAADNPYSGIQMELSLANGLTSKRVLSGVPDSLVCDQGWDRSNGFTTLFTPFASELVTNNWGVVSSSIYANNAGQIPVGATPILNWAADDLVFCRPTMSVGTGFNNGVAGSPPCSGGYVQVICYKSNPGPFPNLNGVYRMGTSSLGSMGTGSNLQTIISFQINKSFKCFSPFFNGYAIPYTGPAFTDIVAAQMTNVVMKKRGGSFGLPHGRRRTVK